MIIHRHLNNVSSLQASKTGSKVTCLELSIRKFRAKINDSLSWKQYSRDFLNKYYTQVLLEHNSSHKAYDTVTIFFFPIYVVKKHSNQLWSSYNCCWTILTILSLLFKMYLNLESTELILIISSILRIVLSRLVSFRLKYIFINI